MNTYVIAEEDEKDNILTYSIRFSSPELKTRTIKDRLVSLIRMEDTQVTSSYGKPVLPIKPVRILLPYKTAISSLQVKVQDSKYSIFPLNMIELGTSTHSFTSSKEFGTSSIMPLFDTKQQYPLVHYENIGVQYQHGYPILYLNLYPIQLYQQKNIIRYHPEIEITIETKTDPSYNPVISNDLKIKNDIKNTVINPTIINSYQQNTFSTKSGQTIDYLLITTEELKNLTSPETYTFDDLIAHRESMGLHCKIVTVEDIEQIYPGVDSPEKIRNCIKYFYEHHALQWVLIGGDFEYVPARYLKSIDGLEPSEDEITSDLYYQCLDGTYNYDMDTIWGEEFDGVNGQRIDLLAEVYIGRAPVDDATDISAFVEKTLIYEQQQWGDVGTDRVLSAGETLWSGNGGYGAGYVERCIDFNSDYDHQTYGIPTDQFTIIELYERDEAWDEQDAIIQINQGVNIINHVGHGTAVSAMKFSVFELEILNNTGKYGLFYSQACHSGQFEFTDNCFAERWVNIPKKGGFAAIMNTGYGYGSTFDYDGPDNRYAREFYDALFSPYEKISRIGRANQDSKEDNIWRIHEDNMYHIYYCKTLFGDPYVSLVGSESISAEFTWDPDYPVIGKHVQFYDQSTGMINYREWDFGDGYSSQQKNPIHVYSHNREYTVTLTVQDEFGYLSSISKTIDVREYWNPIPVITPNHYQGVNFTIMFSAEESWDPDGSIESYHWNFDDGDTSNEKNVAHTFIDEGTYIVELTVVDNQGNIAKASSKIILLDQSPPNKPQITEYTSMVFSGDICTIQLTTSDPDFDQVSYGIDWGDGNGLQWNDTWYDSNQTRLFSHQYQTIGQHTIRVKARDIHNTESPWSDPITITVEDDKDPQVLIHSPKNGIYMKNNYISSFFMPLIFGKITIQVNASDESGIDQVLFFIDDSIHPKAVVLSPPYQFTWDERLFFKHTVTIQVFDNAGRMKEEMLTLWKFM